MYEVRQEKTVKVARTRTEGHTGYLRNFRKVFIGKWKLFMGRWQ
jgi:hypothetical protein